MNTVMLRARKLFDAEVTPSWQRLHDKRRRNLLQGLKDYLVEHPLSDHLIEDPHYFAQAMIDFLRRTAESRLNEIKSLQQGKRQFDARFARASSSGERKALLIDYARELGASPRQLRRDRRAMNRWFGADALQDRWQGFVAKHEQAAEFAMQRLGVLVALELGEHAAADRIERWQRLRYDDLCERMFDGSVHERLVLAALQALNRSVADLSPAAPSELVSQVCQQYIYRLALDPEEPTWLQCAALDLMPRITPEALDKTLTYRLQQPAEGDDLFVRARAVEIWAQRFIAHPALLTLTDALLQDPSALVRQRLAQRLPQIHPHHLSTGTQVATKLAADREPAVRAQVLLSLPALVTDGTAPAWAIELLNATLASEEDEFVYRTALHVWVNLGGAVAYDDQERLFSVVNRRHQQDASLRVRRWSAQAREQLLCAVHADYRVIMQSIVDQLNQHRQELDLTALPQDASRLMIMRVLASLTQNSFGLEVDFERAGKAKLAPLFRFGFRWWRWWYELRNPSTDKRQGFRHTIGRHFDTSERAPSAILAEVSKTKVPGEPLIMPDEDGWRPYLPLVDECLSALQQERDVQIHRIHTSEGITEIKPPDSLLDQLRAWWNLTKNYEHFAAWRNWHEQDQTPASHYIKQLASLGFNVRFVPHACPITGTTPEDSSVSRFFLSLTPISALPSLWLDFKHHVASAYENTVFELTGYVAIIAALFFGRHVLLASLLKRARQRIPLVIGGWGTRGKSGTERLKAAMFNAMGLSVFSKTTGCEAMFVMNRPFRPLRELFLFRPYDKATIWEQFNMVRLASRLDSDVFLWECMGLTPSYVRVLQHDWMRDDISTITNAFPDHEDLQGPAGINIPQVMCEFIPRKGVLVTSEEKMLPLLSADAKDKQTPVHAVNWLDAGLLTPDVLARFPYEEHPYNIALVLGIAKELGIEQDFALKEMADQVVMDLGVLKTYPTADVGDRKLEFIMGMSANERFGALNNWQRMDLAGSTVDAQPDSWITTLVNNRADRVARSRVFADLLVRDISADQHVLIGTNLTGLRGYIEESWQDHNQEFQLWSADEDRYQAESRLRESAQTLRIPVTVNELCLRLSALLARPFQGSDKTTADQLWTAFQQQAEDSDSLTWGKRFYQQHQQFEQLMSELGECTGPDPAFDAVVQSQLWQWFEEKLIVVEDAHISGDDLVAHLAAHAPPRLHNRIMGMQNIKGTGLSFVYAWQSWEEQHALATQLQDDDEHVFNQALDRLVNQPDMGILGRPALMRALEAARHHHAAQRESAQAQINSLIERIEALENEARERKANDSTHAQNTRLRMWLDKFVLAIEAFFDAGDAVRRRRTADRVYADLISASISEDRAIAEIKAINKRQKGGWLSQRLGK